MLSCGVRMVDPPCSARARRSPAREGSPAGDTAGTRPQKPLQRASGACHAAGERSLLGLTFSGAVSFLQASHAVRASETARPITTARCMAVAGGRGAEWPRGGGRTREARRLVGDL
jgi:hypothetical protein